MYSVCTAHRAERKVYAAKDEDNEGGVSSGMDQSHILQYFLFFSHIIFRTVKCAVSSLYHVM